MQAFIPPDLGSVETANSRLVAYYSFVTGLLRVGSSFLHELELSPIRASATVELSGVFIALFG
jgi:hypothetical protein